MKMLWVLPLGLAALVAVQGCKRKEPEPIPGPKAGLAMAVVYAARTASTEARAPGIAWFQGSLDEAFARAAMPRNCWEYGTSPRAGELTRARKKLNLPSSEIPQIIIRPRHRLV